MKNVIKSLPCQSGLQLGDTGKKKETRSATTKLVWLYTFSIKANKGLIKTQSGEMDEKKEKIMGSPRANSHTFSTVHLFSEHKLGQNRDFSAHPRWQVVALSVLSLGFRNGNSWVPYSWLLLGFCRGRAVWFALPGSC